MKTLTSLQALALTLLLPVAVFAAQPGARVGAEESRERASESPNAVAGDGIQNSTQDAPYGSYGPGESPNPISGDGIQNATQGVPYGQYGSTSVPANGARTGSEESRAQTREQLGATGTDSALTPQTQRRMQNGAELAGSLTQTREQVRTERAAMSGTELQVRAGREDAEVALRTIHMAGSLLGDSEQRMTQLAMQLQAREDVALEAEIRTANRSGLTRFFAGGDSSAAAELEEAVTQNRETLRAMTQLAEACTTCEDATRATVREQVRVLETEQVRLEQIASKERAQTGLFDWLFGWL